MKLLKLFLYTILFGSIIWATLILSGPVFLKWAISSYSKDRIILESVKVSPRLQITAGRIEFVAEELLGYHRVSGVLRSAKLSWSLFGEDPFLKFISGPTMVKNFGQVDSIILSTPSLQRIDFGELDISASIKGLKADMVGTVEAIDIEGRLGEKFSKLKDVSAEIFDFVTWDPELMSLVSAKSKISDIRLDLPLDDQKLFVELFSDQLSIENLNLDASELSSTLLFENSDLFFDLNLYELILPDRGISLKTVKVKGAYQNGAWTNPLGLELRNGSLSEKNTELIALDAEIINTNNGVLEAKATGLVSSLELSNGEIYFGTLPANNLKIELNYDSVNHQVNANSTMTFDDPQLSKVAGFVELSLTLDDPEQLLECVSALCQPDDFSLSYQINLGDQSIIGRSLCLRTPCEISKMSHEILTTNTLKVFDEINKTMILNPLTSLSLYGVLSAGEKVGQGHKIKFN